MIARRLGRKMRTAEEPLLQWRRQGSNNAAEVIELYEGIVTPLAFQRGQDSPTGNITFLQNPAFILINPSADEDDIPLDIVQGDTFVRLKYHEPPANYNHCQHFTELEPDRQAELKAIALDAIHQTITVHSFETQFDGIRILGDLQG